VLRFDRGLLRDFIVTDALALFASPVLKPNVIQPIDGRKTSRYLHADPRRIGRTR
jgi:hypothetical protein